MRRLKIRKAPPPETYPAVLTLQRALMSHNRQLIREALRQPIIIALMRSGTLKMRKP